VRLTRRQAFTVAAIIGVIVAGLVYVVLKGQTGTPETPEPQTVTVLVAKQDIAQYDAITSEMVGTTEMASQAAPSGALTAPGQAVGKLAQTAIFAEQTLTTADVSERSAAQGLTFVIPQGMRAVTVALDPISGVGGFVIPHDRVDVLTTFQQGEVAITKTILQNIEVLAMNEQTSRPAARGSGDGGTQTSDEGTQSSTEGGAPATMQVKSATLSVSPDQAQALLLSGFKGAIHLALRPRQDDVLVSLTGQTDWALVGLEPPSDEKPEEQAAQPQPIMPPGWPMYPQPAQPTATPAPQPAPAPEPPSTIEVIRGGDREVVTVE